jgi:hypothetical protein
MIIGKIVKSDSHINYVCQIYGPREVELEPSPTDYAFGRFVRIAVREGQKDEYEYAQAHHLHSQEPITTTYAVGVIHDTILQNPAFGVLGPRLSNETQIELFSPDYITEKAVLVHVMILGMVELRTLASSPPEFLSVMHGVPLLSLELESQVETMTDEEVRAFHFFSDTADAALTEQRSPYLHMGYLPHILAQRNRLLPMVTLRIIDQLERLFPHNLALLSIVKRNFAWRLKVEATG